MGKQKKSGQSGKKGGSLMNEPFDPPEEKGKSKKPKKQSKGKQKK